MKHHNLWVVTSISNPVRYESRYRLYRAFEAEVLAAGANLMTVELGLGGRDFAVTDHGRERHLQLRTKDELWAKENLINLGVQELPDSCEYIAWLDADISFVRPDWATELVQQLQHYKVVQVFQDAIDLGPTGEFLQKHQGFAYSYVSGAPWPHHKEEQPHWHPGFGWACRRSTWDELGGLMEGAILGAADHHMACAYLGRVVGTAPSGLAQGYYRMLRAWEDRATAANIRQHLGYMPGTILHHWHGKKRDRRYQERWKILQKHAYDPDFDVSYDWQGVLQLTQKGERMRNDLRAYFRSRNEDSIDL